VRSLNEVLPYDWRSFLDARVNALAPAPPLDGIERGGWRLAYGPAPSTLQKAYEAQEKRTDMSASIGLTIEKDGSIRDIVPGGPADRAGIGPGMSLVAVNARRYSVDVLRDAVAATKGSSAPLELLMENGEYFRSFALDYHEGAKYPRLERVPGRDDLLSAIIKPAS
jgi:predicted metalloprotease with PDZ domain